MQAKLAIALLVTVTTILFLPVFGQITAKEWLEKGDAFFNQSRYDNAIIAYHKAITQTPNDPHIWFKKGDAYRHQNNNEKAIKCFNETIRLDPNYVSAWNLKGYILNNQGNYLEAINALEEAIRIDRNNSTTWNNMGVALLGLGRYNESIMIIDKAILAFNESIRLNPNNTASLSNKGLGLVALGHHNEAIKCFEEAIRLDPANPRFKLNKYSVLDTQGNLTSGLEMSGEPSYALEIQTSSNKINPGDNFTLIIYIEGSGDVDYNKLRVNIPPYIVEKGTLNYKVNTFFSEKRLYFRNENDTMFLIFIPNIYFIGNWDLNKLLLDDDNPKLNLSNIGGIDDKEGAPIIINFTASKDAPSGDHNIHLNLFYKNSNKWFMDKQVVPLHINHWYENELLQKFAIMAVAIGIIASLLGIIKEFWPEPWFRKR